MKLPETIYTARIIGNHVYEWNKEDGLIRKRMRNVTSTAKVIGYADNPTQVDPTIKRDYFG